MKVFIIIVSVIFLGLIAQHMANAAECNTTREGDVTSVICNPDGIYSASAASEYEADEDGNGYIEVYKPAKMGDWHRFKDVYNTQEANRFPDEARIRMVGSKARADVWVHFGDLGDPGCRGSSIERVWFGDKDLLDEIVINDTCRKPRQGLWLHEGGHNFLGFGHVQCTSRNQNRSVMVATLNDKGETIGGCNVTLNRFGRLDIRKAEPFDPLGI